MSEETSNGGAGERAERQRSIWKGTLVFGLVSIPVALHRAVAEKGVHFHELHDEDGARIRRVSVCTHDGQPVTRAHIVHGYEIEHGKHVQILPEELAALDPPASRAIAIEAFVDPAEIDPTLYDRTYYLAPGEGAARAYALLAEAMKAQRLYAVARIVLRSRRRLALVRPAGPPSRPASALALTLLDFADEVRPVTEIEGLPGPEILLGDREIDLALRLIEAHAERFHPERYRDEHRERVLDLVRRKAEGAPAAPPPAQPVPAPKDLGLVGALEESLRDAERQKRAA